MGEHKCNEGITFTALGRVKEIANFLLQDFDFARCSIYSQYGSRYE